VWLHIKMRKINLIVLFLLCWAAAVASYAEDLTSKVKVTPTPVVIEKAPDKIQFSQFKNAIRQKIIEEQQLSIAYDDIKKEYASSGGVYKANIKKNLNEPFPIGFEYDGKSLAFEFVESNWIYSAASKTLDTQIYEKVVTEISKSVDSLESFSATSKRIDYAKSGNFKLSVDMTSSKFKKIVEIDSADFTIPKDAEYLELKFKIDSDMNLPPDGIIGKRWELAEDCWLEPAKAGIRGTTEYITIRHEFIDGVYKKYIPVSYLTGQIYTDADITFGSAYVYNSGSTHYISCAALSSSAFVVSYQDGGNSNYGTSIIGTIPGTVITATSNSRRKKIINNLLRGMLK